MTPDFWKNKIVFISGHTGFKGAWLSLWLQNLGAKVIGYALSPPTKPSLFEKADIASGIHSIKGDIRNLKQLKKVFNKYQPEIVFHLAAQSLVRYSYQEPVETYETNVMGTLNILEAIRDIKSVRAVIMVTTDKCYENKEWPWAYRENEALGGYDPYSSSKGCAELLISSYRNSYFSNKTFNEHRTAIASVRAGNVIGGGDWADDRLIPDIIRAFQANNMVNIRNPDAIRPWQHVLEPLAGYMKLAERLYNNGIDYAQAWNFGPLEQDAKPVQWIVKQMANMWSNEAGWKIIKDDVFHEANYLKLDCSKAHNQLDWWPKWDLKTALQKIVHWHKVEVGVKVKGEALRKLCLEQIHDYSSRNMG
ncbi:MAG: CDP-glucose 4,6-dehydratase [Bacteroidota bacterium]